MIGDVIVRSLRERSPLIPVEALLGNCDGSRMPEIVADRLTQAIVQKARGGVPHGGPGWWKTTKAVAA